MEHMEHSIVSSCQLLDYTQETGGYITRDSTVPTKTYQQVPKMWEACAICSRQPIERAFWGLCPLCRCCKSSLEGSEHSLVG